MEIPEKPEHWRKILSENNEDIFELIKDKEVFKFIIECNNEYLHWDKLRRMPIPKNIDPKKIWALIKIFRNEKYISLKFNGFGFRYVLQPNTLKKLHFLDKESAGNLQIDDRIIHKQGQERYIISSLMEEAIASSIIEGASTTRKFAKSMLQEKRKPKTKSEKMIVNNFETMQYILSIKDKKITPELILEIQKK